MGKKANAANAREWHENVRIEEQNKRSLEDQAILLWYAGNKRKTNYPSAQELSRLGFVEVSQKVSQAYALLSEASYLFDKQRASSTIGETI